MSKDTPEVKKKIVILESCNACPWMVFSGSGGYCEHEGTGQAAGRDIETGGNNRILIPAWCPLEDAD